MPTDPLDTLIPAAERIAAELRALSRTVDATRAPAPVPSDAIDRTAQCVELARIIYHHRRTRGHLHPMFETFEPNWHMALALYVADATGPALTLPELSRAARLSASATRRRLAGLARSGVVVRTSDPAMPSRAIYHLTADGGSRVCDYLTSVVRLLT